ncbi:hypothetical protein RJ640_023351 [Escallonia rubra]|uniref:Uncharacterized protein n=1 Tax=Escallonia rubra TaxID=112253 RepID=A0AA88RPQ6_9ASTE|nr:hypothetical protein RJ640_023351 [Escallonia rubra]
MPLSRFRTVKRSCSANLDECFHEEPSNHVEDLAQMLEVSDYDEKEQACRENKTTSTMELSTSEHRSVEDCKLSFLQSKLDLLEPRMLGIKPELPDWAERDALKRASIEWKANRVDLPVSLRMIKKKQRWKKGLKDLGELESCSVRKAFSSMVFIILELHIYALRMREVLCYDDLKEIIAEVHDEMHASFVWLFQQVFSQTPALMFNVMILLANFSMYSTAHSIDVIIPPIVGPSSASTTKAGQNQQYLQVDSPVIKLDLVKGNNGGTTKVHPVAGGIGDEDGDLSSTSLSMQYADDVPDEIHRVSYEELSSAVEVNLWKSMVDESIKMQSTSEDVVLDHDIKRFLVAPVNVEIEPDDYVDYFRTDLLYQMGISQEPNSPLLLCNYAQFLHLVAHDYGRAEECFKRAIQVEPPDAESLSQYANFLWKVKKDLWGAEEKYLQALAAEPDNPYHASRYASFLWITGGDETCFPL